MKHLIVTSIPSPYRIPLFNEIAERSAGQGCQFKVVFLTAGYKRRKWSVDPQTFKFDNIILDDPKFVRGESFFSTAFSLPFVLVREKPDKILVGGFSAAAIWTMLYARLMAVPYAVWSGDTLNEEMLRGGLQIRRIVRRLIIRHARAFVAYGTRAKEYLETMGINSRNIRIGINTVETTRLEREASEIRSGGKTGFEKSEISERNILFVGYLEKRKGIFQLIEAFSLLYKQGVQNATLHIVGSGSEEAALKSHVESLGLTHVKFWGYKQQNELPRFFALADFLVFPSINELYGLVPIEAMAAGLPVICSENAGCSVDLINDGMNGLLVNPMKTADLASQMARLLGDEDLRKKLGERARKTVQRRFSIARSADGFMQTFDAMAAQL